MGSLAAPDAPGGDIASTLVIDERLLVEMAAHCLRRFPEEGCGLLAGNGATGHVVRCFPVRNQAASACRYVVDPEEHLRADRKAEQEGLEIIGVFHSHTHTDAYPSATDVERALDPTWHYVLVSLRAEVPSVRSFRIIRDSVMEEPVVPS